MRKYKSVQTYYKLQEFKPSDPDILFSNFNEIDKKFDDLCQKSKAELFPEDVKLEQAKQITKQQQQQLNKDVGDNFTNLIDRDMKQQLKKNMDQNQVNPLVDMFGNALIATVFQSLLIKTVENLWNIKIKVDSNIPISSNVLKVFDISVLSINAYKTKEEKQQYILEQMDKKIDELMKDQLKDIKAHQKIADEYINDQKSKKSKKREDDYFPWLQLKTKYQSLKKRLRAQIIEQINEYDNMKKISETLDQKQLLKKMGFYNQAKYQHTSIDRVKFTSTKEVFNNMYQYGNPKTQQFLSRLGLGNEKQTNLKKKKQNNNSSFDYEQYEEMLQKKEEENQEKNKKKDELKNEQFTMYFYLNRKGLKKDYLMEKQFPKWKEEDINLINEQGEKISENEMLNNENYKFWNDQKEFQFQIQRHEKQSLYNKEVNSSSWNDIGFLPFVQKYVIEMKKSMEREHLLDKYCDGNRLTDDEFKFMANTSELLNQCLDKKFMQSAANSIDPSIIDNMELGLAEEIIKNYQEIQIAMKQSRQQYINEKRKQTAENFKVLDIQFQKKKLREANQHFQNRYRKMLKTLVQRLEREGRFKEQPPNDVIGAKSVHKFLTGEIDQYILVRNLKRLNINGGHNDQKDLDDSEDSETIRIREKQQILDQKKERLNKMAQPVSNQGRIMDRNIKKHWFHPSSKLFVNPNKDQEFDGGEGEVNSMSEAKKKTIQEKLKQNKSESDNFQLHLKSNKNLRNPYCFVKHNSGGPQQPVRKEPFYNPMDYYKPMKATPYELSKIIMIQKNVRAQLLKKHFKDVKNKKLQNLREEYKFKINKLQWPDVRIKLEGNQESIQDLKVLTKKDIKEMQKQQQQQQEDSQKEDTNNKSLSKKSINPQHSQIFQLQSNNDNKRQPTKLNIDDNQSYAGYSSKIRPSTAHHSKHIEFNFQNQQDIQNYSSTEFQKKRPLSGLFGNRIQSQSINLKNNKSHINQGQIHAYSQRSIKIQQDVGDSIKYQKDEEEQLNQLQLKRRKLFEAAKKNQFWIINTGRYQYNNKDLNSRDKDGNTALHYVTKFANLEFLEWLLSSGANPNLQNKKLNSPLHVAFKTQKIDIINILINYGGDLNLVNVKLQTPLHFGNERVLKILGLLQGIKTVNSEDYVFDNNCLLKCNKKLTINDTMNESTYNANNSTGIQDQNDTKSNNLASFNMIESLNHKTLPTKQLI